MGVPLKSASPPKAQVVAASSDGPRGSAPRPAVQGISPGASPAEPPLKPPPAAPPKAPGLRQQAPHAHSIQPPGSTGETGAVSNRTQISGAYQPTLGVLEPATLLLEALPGVKQSHVL